MVTVRLDVTGLTVQQARLEFGFASADNGATTYVDLDAAAVSDRPTPLYPRTYFVLKSLLGA
jgi:hypothetical protein